MLGDLTAKMLGPIKGFTALFQMERDHLFALAIFFGGLCLGWLATMFSQAGNSRQHTG